MSYFLTMRAGPPGGYQFSPRIAFASFEQARDTGENAFSSKGAEYLIEDERGTVTYRLHGAS